MKRRKNFTCVSINLAKILKMLIKQSDHFHYTSNYMKAAHLVQKSPTIFLVKTVNVDKNASDNDAFSWLGYCKNLKKQSFQFIVLAEAENI